VLTRLLFTTEDKIKNAFTVILLSALLPILLAYYQLVTGHGTIHDAGQDRIVGTFLHPNAFGSYLLIILIFSVVQVLEGFPMGHKSFLGGFTFLAFVIFVFTLSRGAWIVFVLSMLLLGKLRYRKLLGLIPPLVLVAVLGVPAVRNRIMDLVEPNSQYAAGRSAWEWRLNTWEEIGPLVKEEPLIGHGLAMIETEFGILTHNDYLRLLAETGIIGCAGYLILAFSTLRRSWRDYKQSRTRLGLSLQLSTVAMISGFLVRQFADNSLRNTVVMIYFWVLIALARNMNILDQASSEDDNPPPPEEEPEPEIVPDPTGEAEPEPEPVLEGTL
jgi:O-antigen ligase